MAEEQATCLEIYLTKDGQNSLSKREMVAIMQLLRIITALRFQTSLFLPFKEEKHLVFKLRAQMEISAILASSFKEAAKEFFNNLFKILSRLSDEEDLKRELSAYDQKTKNFKDGGVHQIVDYIRNNFSFHMSSDLFKDYVTEDNAIADMLIGIALSERIGDCLFTKGYDALIFQITKMAENISEKTKIPDWLMENIVRETDYFCDLLEKFGGSIVKKYGVKRLATSDGIGT
jgi:hypothetical protein